MTGAGPTGAGDGRPQDPDTTTVLPAMADDSTGVLPVIAAGAPPGRSVVRHSAVMALGSVISRITGFVRTAAIGAAIGVVAVGDAYNLANTLPGMVYELLLGGVLASVVIPLLVRARRRDADGGEAYAQRLLTLAVLMLGVATVVAVLCAPLFTALLTNDKTKPAAHDLITTLSYLLLPMIFFYGMAALFAAILNTRDHFAMPTFAPILNNLVVIAMTAGFFLVPLANPDDASSITTGQVLLLGLGTTLGIVIQAVGLWPALRRVGFRWMWRFDFRALHLRELGRMSGWMLTYVIVSQAAVLVILNLAQRAADSAGDAAGPAIFYNGYLMFMMAHGIVAVSIITVLMPRLAEAAAEHRPSEIVRHLAHGTRLIAVVLVPATVGYLVLGRPLAVTLFQFGQYGHDKAVATGWVIAVAGLGLVPFAISQLQLFTFYAMPDTRTPALVNMPVVAVRIAVDLLLFVVLPATWVAAGLMAGNAVSFVVAAAIGYALLRRRLGRLGLTDVLLSLARMSLAGLIAAVPTGLVVLFLTATMGGEKFASFVQLLVAGPVLIGSYVAAALVLRVPEVRELISMVRARLSR